MAFEQCSERGFWIFPGWIFFLSSSLTHLIAHPIFLFGYPKDISNLRLQTNVCISPLNLSHSLCKESSKFRKKNPRASIFSVKLEERSFALLDEGRSEIEGVRVE